MGDRHTEKMRRLADAVLEGPGESDVEVRRAVEALAAELGGRPLSSLAEAPPILRAYVEKVAKHAYKVTERDIEGLRMAGFSEDAVLEITLCAALGAALARLERGLATLDAGR